MYSFTNSSSKSDHEVESTSSTTTTNPKKKSYDVYLSFCDEDAGDFALRLYAALSLEDEFVIFWDDERHGSGNRELPTSLLNVIEDCKVVVIVFSRKYVMSRSCLQELEKITECCQTTYGLIVLPVFYDGIHPCDGRLQRGMFGETFRHFLDRILTEDETSSKVEDKFLSWVAVISKATAYSGSSKAATYSRSSHLVDRYSPVSISNLIHLYYEKLLA